MTACDDKTRSHSLGEERMAKVLLDLYRKWVEAGRPRW